MDLNMAISPTTGTCCDTTAVLWVASVRELPEPDPTITRLTYEPLRIV